MVAPDGEAVRLTPENAADFAHEQACALNCDAEARACRVLAEAEGGGDGCAPAAEACRSACRAPPPR